MSDVEVKVIGKAGDRIITIASEIAQSLRLVGFKVSISGKIKGEGKKKFLSQTKRIHTLIASEQNKVHISCEQLKREV